MPLARELRHCGSAPCQPVLPRRVEPETVVRAGVELRRHGHAVIRRPFQLHHQERALRQFRPEAVANVGFIVHLLRSEEHTSELQSLMRISYAVFCLKKKTYPHLIYKTSPT